MRIFISLVENKEHLLFNKAKGHQGRVANKVLSFEIKYICMVTLTVVC